MEYARMLSVEDVPYFYIPECDVTGDWQDLQTDSFNMRWCVDTASGEVPSWCTVITYPHALGDIASRTSYLESKKI